MQRMILIHLTIISLASPVLDAAAIKPNKVGDKAVHIGLQKDMNAKQFHLPCAAISNGFLYSFQDLSQSRNGLAVELLSVDLGRQRKPFQIWRYGSVADPKYRGHLKIGAKGISAASLFHVPFTGSRGLPSDLHVSGTTWAYPDLEGNRQVADTWEIREGLSVTATKHHAGQRLPPNRNNPVLDVFRLYSSSGNKDPLFYYDYHPTAGANQPVFLLANHNIQSGAQKAYFLPRAEVVPDDSVEAEPILAVWERVGELKKDNRPNPKEDPLVWFPRQKIVTAFNEPFRVIVGNHAKRPEDYLREAFYFLTQSGKIYVSVYRDRVRKMEPLWNDASRPIVCMILDADTDKPYLFGRSQDKDPQKRRFFIDLSIHLAEPANPVKLYYYDPKDYWDMPAPEPFRSLVEYAQALIIQKLIKVPIKKK